MAEKSRGTALTIFALLFGLLAISNFAKPFHIFAGDGFVFMGVKQTGTPNAILGPLFGVLLLIYAYGIWTMRRYALPVAYIYTVWVIVNMVLFTLKNQAAQPTPPVFAIISIVIGVGIPLATAIILSRRSAELG